MSENERQIEKKILEKLIDERNIPVTFRNAFKRYLIWRNELET
jgi:hypothetical protein